MVKIAFHQPQLDVRGSCVALYDYALHNETILKNQSIIVVDGRKKSNNDIDAVLKFCRRFRVFFYNDCDHLHNILLTENCDIIYTIKYGKKDDIVFPDIKTVVHCVFDLSEPHGDVYAAVSSTLAKKYNYPLYVPHMVSLVPSLTGENLRSQLGIPNNALVFGRHGGHDTFNIPFCINAIAEIVQTHKNIFFLFVNTPIFFKHSQVIFLPPFIHNDDKNRFIQTCDAHLECGTLGHTFGLAMAEFSVNNKPIIAYKGKLWNTAHLDILKDNAIYFTTENEFKDVILSFDPIIYKRDMNCYKEFSPQKVMTLFNDVFIQCTVTKNC